MTSFAILAAADVAHWATRLGPPGLADSSFAHLPNPFPGDDDDERPIGDPDDDEGEGEDDEDEDDEEPMQLRELASATHRPAGAPLRRARRIAAP